MLKQVSYIFTVYILYRCFLLSWFKSLICYIFIYMHLEEAFIQSDLHCITFKVPFSKTHEFVQRIYFLEKLHYHEKFKRLKLKITLFPLKFYDYIFKLKIMLICKWLIGRFYLRRFRNLSIWIFISLHVYRWSGRFFFCNILKTVIIELTFRNDTSPHNKPYNIPPYMKKQSWNFKCVLGPPFCREL